MVVLAGIAVIAVLLVNDKSQHVNLHHTLGGIGDLIASDRCNGFRAGSVFLIFKCMGVHAWFFERVLLRRPRLSPQ